MAAKVVGSCRVAPQFFARRVFLTQVCCSHGGELGSGVGKGGGSGGSVREAGGGMGKQGAVQEEEYFRRLHEEQLDALKDHVNEEIHYHEKWIERHKDSIKHYKKQLKELDDDD